MKKLPDTQPADGFAHITALIQGNAKVSPLVRQLGVLLYADKAMLQSKLHEFYLQKAGETTDTGEEA